MVTPGPCPRTEMLLLIRAVVPCPDSRNVPAPSTTTCPTGQALMAACMALVSSPPLGDSVGPHCVVRVGMPPMDSRPALAQLALASRLGVSKAPGPVPWPDITNVAVIGAAPHDARRATKRSGRNLMGWAGNQR